MRIGFAGTMSVGKTTLVKALAELPEFKDYFIATERSKYLRDLGIPLNTDSSLPGQVIFLAERASEIMRDNVLTDRTVWDVCAFTDNAKSIDVYAKYRYIELATCMGDQYDIVFYISPEGVEIEDNGVREIDSEYRDVIDETIVALINRFPPKRLINIKGTTEERVALVLEAFYKYL
jgi:nicotinamide riboside kinase